MRNALSTIQGDLHHDGVYGLRKMVTASFAQFSAVPAHRFAP
jgi:hypothetical protein